MSGDERRRVEAPGDAGLIIRVWREPDDPSRVRGRVLTFRGGDEPRTCAVTADEQDLVDAVTTWIRSELDGPPGRAPKT